MLTDKGMLRYVHQNRNDIAFTIAKTVDLYEGLFLKTVFSAIVWVWPRAGLSVIVASFDVDRHANIFIVQIRMTIGSRG